MKPPPFVVSVLALLCLAAPARALVMRKFATVENSQIEYGLYAELVWGPDSPGTGGEVAFWEPVIYDDGTENWSWFGGYFSVGDAGGLLYIEAADGDKNGRYEAPFAVASTFPISLYQPFGAHSYLAFDTGVWGSFQTLFFSPLPDTDWGCIVSADSFFLRPQPIKTPDQAATAWLTLIALALMLGVRHVSSPHAPTDSR